MHKMAGLDGLQDKTIIGPGKDATESGVSAWEAISNRGAR